MINLHLFFSYIIHAKLIYVLIAVFTFPNINILRIVMPKKSAPSDHESNLQKIILITIVHQIILRIVYNVHTTWQSRVQDFFHQGQFGGGRIISPSP